MKRNISIALVLLVLFASISPVWADDPQEDPVQWSQEIKFRGTAIASIFWLEPGQAWVVRVGEVIFGPSISGDIEVVTSDWDCTKGYVDPDIDRGDNVEVYGLYNPSEEFPVQVCSSDDYYIIEISGPSYTVTVTADPESIPADGSSTSTIIASVVDQYDNPVPDGTTVTFSTDLGIFVENSSQTYETTTTAGVAIATLQSSAIPGTATVTATADSRSDQIDVIFYYVQPRSCGLTVTSDGCCPISVEYDDVSETVPAGGTLTFSDIPLDTDVILTADASDVGCDFVNWTGDVTSTDNPITIHMDSDKSVTAHCEVVPPCEDPYEPDNTCGEANWIPTDGSIQTHRFCTAGDHDWVKFNAQTGCEYTIETLNLGSESDTVITLYDQNCSTLIDEDDDGGSGLASRIVWTAPSSGIYFVRIRHYSSSRSGPNTNYDIRVIEDCSPADNVVYLDPQHSSASFCKTTEVEIWVDATNFQGGQIKLTYNSTCADVINWERNTDDFPYGTWDSDTPGEEWITFSAEGLVTGEYLIGTLTIHCVSDGDCTTALDFVAPSALKDNWGNEIPATWTDGTFECTRGMCGDVAPYPDCDGKIDMGDFILLLNYVGHPGDYSLCCEWCGDVAPYPDCDGKIDMGDFILLLNHVGHPGDYHLCCEAASSTTAAPAIPMTAENEVNFVPQESRAAFCNTAEVEIWVNATNFQGGQIKFTYDSTCADVTNWERNTEDFPYGTWESDTPGEEWITFSAEGLLTGEYLIGILTIHCASEGECTTALDFVDPSALKDNWGNEIPATWTDGTFRSGMHNLYFPLILRDYP